MRYKYIALLLLGALPFMARAEDMVGQERIAQSKIWRSDKEIQDVFNKNRRALYLVYSKALRENAKLSGKMIMKITILPSGDVGGVTLVRSSLDDNDLETQTMDIIKGFDFGEKDVGTVVIHYPVEYLPADS